MECAICYNLIVDKVSRTCISQHPFCFKCILSNIEANSESTSPLGNCASCRGGDKYIMLTNELNQPVDEHYSNIPRRTTQSTQINEPLPSSQSDPFYTLKYFKKSLPILQKNHGRWSDYKYLFNTRKCTSILCQK